MYSATARTAWPVCETGRVRIRVIVGVALAILNLAVIGLVVVAAATGRGLDPNPIPATLGFNLFGAAIWWAAGPRRDDA